MHVTSIRRWHWMIIGLAVGAAIGWVHSASMNFATELSGYGRRLGQREFERAIGTELHGRRAFTKLTIQPYWLNGSSESGVKVHVVTGLYCDGEERAENGRIALHWDPAYFVASVPFAPVGDDDHALVSQRSFPDVAAYLASLQSAGVNFAVDRWWWVVRPMFLWTFGGFVVIGIAWPTVINLLAFGSLTRPVESAGESLAGVKPPRVAKPQTPQIDFGTIRELDRQLEETLTTSEGANTNEARPIASLTDAPLPAVIASEPDQKQFAAKQEDYYPTELGAKHGT